MHPDIPEDGISLEELFAKKGMPVSVDKAMAHLKKAAARFGVPLGDRTKTFNSRLAQEMGLWANEKGRGHAFHDAAFRAYFVDGLNLAKKDVLLGIAKGVGLDPVAAETLIEERTFKDAVDADWELSRQKGITAVPTFIMGLDKLVGAQPHGMLEKMVLKYKAMP